MENTEKNNWDHANGQGGNFTDFNREKPESEYENVRQEAADEDNVHHNYPSFRGQFDFLHFGTSDDDIQI